MDLKKYFVKSELIPAIIQEKSTGEVLMLAYMNEESLKLTLETGYTWFWSRSRQVKYTPQIYLSSSTQEMNSKVSFLNLSSLGRLLFGILPKTALIYFIF